jgi:phosphoribosylglycinamide formyltransferase 1
VSSNVNEPAHVPLPRIAVLASGSGTNLQALLDATACGTLEADVSVVVSDRADAGALQRAAAAGVATVSLPLADRRDPVVREVYDRRLAALICAFEPDLIVLAGWMLILSPRFLNTFPGRIVNVHPALLPDGDGVEVLTSHGRLPALRGPRTVRDALRQQLPATGATVHYVTSVVDCGPVLLREEVPILPDDDEVGLHQRIKSVEHRLLPRGVAMALAAVSASNVEREGC